MDKSQSRSKVLSIERLPAMPHVAVRLLDALAGDQTTAIQLEKIIQSDQALASKILSLANSAYYGFSQQVTTIQRAVVAIGMRDLRLLSLGASLTGVFDPSAMPDEFDGEGLWIHCLAVSLAAREVAFMAGQAKPGEMMVAGLLHDIGKLVIGVYLEEEAEFLCKEMRTGSTYYEAEVKLGLSHTLIGHWLVRKWELPPIHAAAIHYHHSPKPSDIFYKTACIVALANELVKEAGFGVVHDSPPVNHKILMTEIGLKNQQIDKLNDWMKSQIPPVLDGWRSMN